MVVATVLKLPVASTEEFSSWANSLGFGILVNMAAIATLAMLLATSVQQAPVAKIQVGDKLGVVVVEDEKLGGEYVVLDDGSITGVGFGRVVVAGKTVEQARVLIRDGLKRVLKSPTVSLVVIEQKKRFVFVTSLVGTAPGPIEFEPELDVRRIITGITLPEQSDDIEVRLFRGGTEVGQDSLDRVLQGVGDFGSTKLEPNDVVTLAEVVKNRIYVSGKVKEPGEFRVREGTDALQAVALAGGTIETTFGEFSYTIQVRRGTTVYEVSDSPRAERFALEPGDTVIVSVPEQIRVSVGGDVRTPGLWTLRKGTDLLSSIQRSGGVTVDGSLSNVLVIRNGESYILDLSPAREGQDIPDFKVEDGDLVFVRRNDNRLMVLGYVKNPKSFRMDEGREYRLADAVSEGGGTDARGTYHRVYLGRRDATGKVSVEEYKLAAFMKDGDLSQNPILEPGDVVMVGEVKGMTLANVSTILSNALLLNSLFGR